jgi:sulfur-oxidizing protein SoxX
MKRAAILIVALCALPASAEDRGGRVSKEVDARVSKGVDARVSEADAVRELMHGFNPRGQAGLSRLLQDDVQAFCSRGDWAKDRKTAQALEKEQLARVKYPAGGMMGDWLRGERVAQSGVGKQFSDNPATPAGGNCYACHQLSGAELSYGTIGPSLRNFGRTRGSGEAAQRYAYSKIYNAKAYSVCSNMPRFGENGILTEEQIKDLVALLLDPDSPVNK